jgi:demethylmenaquinone methyltransferase/2-methoxy-6-polyprenyl-1,4-benzoquinol methylase
LLLESIGRDGYVTGLDVLPELLAYGEDFINKAGLSTQITFRQGDVSDLPFDEDSFDWVWSADCIGYPAGNVKPVLQELKRVVKPGGSIILLGWTSQQVLPGYPLLEACLNATCSAYLPFTKDQPPTSNFMRLTDAFQNAGIQNIQAQTFVGDVRSPLGEQQCIALASLFKMLWGTPQPEASQEDFKEFQRLCDPASSDFILDVPGYYAFFTYSMFRGRVVKRVEDKA